MVRAALVALVCACGRIGFDSHPAADANGDTTADALACSNVSAVDWFHGTMPLDSAKAYAVSSDGMTVLDTVTNLRWQRDVAASTMTATQALAYCASLALAGCSQWRVPQRIELATIVDHRFLSPTIQPAAFPNTPIDADYWTGSPNTSVNNTWETNLANGNTAWNSDSLLYHVRCVHSESVGTPPPARYTVGVDTVFDHDTQLEWTNAADPATESHDGANLYCLNLAQDGGGWRLPEVQELETLVDISTTTPAFDTTAFPAIPATMFWTASPYLGAVSMVMDLGEGSTINSANSSLFAVMCVR